MVNLILHPLLEDLSTQELDNRGRDIVGLVGVARIGVATVQQKRKDIRIMLLSRIEWEDQMRIVNDMSGEQRSIQI